LYFPFTKGFGSLEFRAIEEAIFPTAEWIPVRSARKMGPWQDAWEAAHWNLGVPLQVGSSGRFFFFSEPLSDRRRPRAVAVVVHGVTFSTC